jgi:hypothetical protein
MTTITAMTTMTTTTAEAPRAPDIDEATAPRTPWPVLRSVVLRVAAGRGPPHALTI